MKYGTSLRQRHLVGRFEKGEEVHQQWAKDVEYEFTLGRMLRLLAALLMCATVIMLIRGQ